MYIIIATINTETKIPIPKPALKIPSITEQLVTKKEADSKTNAVVNLFFIIDCFKIISTNFFKIIVITIILFSELFA